MYETPTEALKDAVKRGDIPEAEMLLQEFRARNLDVEEIENKVLRSLESDAKKERKETVTQVVRMIEKADTPKKREEMTAQVKLMIEQGVITPEMERDILSELKREARKESLGE